MKKEQLINDINKRLTANIDDNANINEYYIFLYDENKKGTYNIGKSSDSRMIDFLVNLLIALSETSGVNIEEFAQKAALIAQEYIIRRKNIENVEDE